MFSEQLKREISVDLAGMRKVVEQIELICACYENGATPGIRDTAAAALFLSQFYMGVENVLKRICRASRIALPSGPNWHVALLERFRPGANEGCPAILSDELYADLDMYRRYRHVVLHSYAYTLVWEKLAPGLEAVGDSFLRFEMSLREFSDGGPRSQPPSVREDPVPYNVHCEAPELSRFELSALAIIKQRVGAICAIRECVLFGARLREGFEADMDVDLLIVAEREVTPAEHAHIREVVLEANALNDTLFSVLCISATEWYGSSPDLQPLRKAVASGGVPV